MSASVIAADSLRWLVCPVCRHSLQFEPGIELGTEPGIVRCTGCSRGYPIIDGIPVLIGSRAFLPRLN